MREGVVFCNQVERRAFKSSVTHGHNKGDEREKGGRDFYSLRGARPVYHIIDGAHPPRGGRLWAA